MRPDVLVGPSEWVVEQFGDKVAGELWTRVPEALSTAIDREVNAHPAMTQTQERVLANPRWPLPYEELVLFLGSLPGAEIISVPKSVYQLRSEERRVGKECRCGCSLLHDKKKVQ